MGNIKGLFSLITGLLMIVFFASSVGAATGSEALAYGTGIVSLIGAFIPRAQGVFFDAASPDFTALAAYAGKHSKALYRRLITGLDIAKDITLVPNVKHALNLYKLSINNGPKPYTGDFLSEGNDLAFSGRKLEVEAWQRDVLIDPHKYRTQFLGEDRGAGEGANNQKTPFAQFTMEAIADENANALNLQTAFNGIGKSGFSAYSAATAYTAGAYVAYTHADGQTRYYRVAAGGTTAADNPVSHPAKFINVDALAIAVGLGTRIKSARTGGTLTRVATTGSLLTNTIDNLKKVYRTLPEAQRTQKINYMYVSQSVFEAAEDDFIDTQKYTIADKGLTHLPGSNKMCILKPVSWMSGSGMAICTTKDNLMMGTDLLSDMNSFKVLPRMYKLELGLAGVIGFNFQDEDAIAVNDQN